MSSATPEPADFQVNQYTTTPLGSRTYDRNGNLTSSGNNSYVYDYRDQLVQFTCPGTNTTYAYDALGRCIVRTFNGMPTHYLYDGWQEVEERDVANNTQATYVYGVYVDDLVGMSHGPANYYYHADDLDSIQKVTDTSGNVVEQYRYGDDGTPFIYDGSGMPRGDSAIGNYHLFNGHRYDLETGLYYFRARALDPEAGRFITRDPMGAWYDDSSLGNGFTFAGNNAPTYVDPFGYGLGKAGVYADLVFHVDFCKGDYKLTGSFWAGICVNTPWGCKGPQVSLKGTIKKGNVSQFKLFNCKDCADPCGPGWLKASPLVWLQKLEYVRKVSFEIWIMECEVEASVSACRASLSVGCSANLLEQIPGSDKALDALKKVGAEAEIGVGGSFGLSVCAAKGGGATTGSADGEIKGWLKVGWGL
jgi:RHS repeat-associated protein